MGRQADVTDGRSRRARIYVHKQRPNVENCGCTRAMSAVQSRFEDGKYHHDVTITKVSRLPRNPNIVGFPVPSDGSSSGRSYGSAATANAEPREDKDVRKILLKIDQMSFITGSACAELQACHLITPARGRRGFARKQNVVSNMSDTNWHR